MTRPSDWDYALSSARDYSKPYVDALVKVLDTAWAVEAYLKEKEMPHDGATIANFTAQVLAKEEQLEKEVG